MVETPAHLNRKVALVTGASSGLGKEFAEVLFSHGYRLVLASRRLGRLQQLCEELGSDRAVAIALDVSAGEESIFSAVDSAWEAFGSIHVLVNNAGVRGSVNSPLTLKEDDWNNTMNTNARGAWLVAKAVGRHMKASKQGGSIINISSTAGLDRGLLPGALAYSGSKAALNQMTKAMALELGKYNIRVNAIAAGIFKSEITNELFDKEWMVEAAKQVVPLQRFGQTNPDLTSLILLLVNPKSNYITGNIFVVDGGQSLLGIPVRAAL